jgi:hypothetical protein
VGVESLVSAMFTVDGTVLVHDGNVVVLFRNGRVTKILQPGKHRRLTGLPVMGTLDAVRVRRAEELISHRVESVRTADPDLPLSAATLQVKVEVRDDDNFSALAAYIRRHGHDQFATLLKPELEESLDEVTRQVIRAHTHETLYSMPSLRSLIDVGTELMDGLFRITSVLKVVPEFNPRFVKIQAIKDEAAVAVEAEREQFKVDEEREERLRIMAEGRGITVMQLENPEFWHEMTMVELNQRAEIIKVMLENPRFAGRLSPEMLERFALAAISSNPAPEVIGRTQSPGVLDAGDAAVPRLTIDPRLEEAWIDLRLNSSLAAASITRTDGGVIALVAVGRGQDTPDQRELLTKEIERLYPDRDAAVLVIDAGRDPLELSERYLAQVLPQLQNRSFDARVRLESDQLVIDLTIDGRARDVERALDEAPPTVLEPLRRIFGAGSVRTAVTGD